METSPNFLYMLLLAIAQSSFDSGAIHYMLTVLWMTSCLPIIGLWRLANRVFSQSDSTGGKVMMFTIALF